MKFKKKPIVLKKEALKKADFAKVFSIIYIVFLSIFALDVFGGNYNFLQLIFALVVHLIPSIVVLLLLIYSLKKRGMGGWLFIFLSLVFTFAFETYTNFLSFLLISFPLFLIGLLFIKTNSGKWSRR